MYTIYNNVEDIVIGQFDTDAEFIHFVRKIAVENEDEELSILSVGEAKDYIKEYCDNLDLPIARCARTNTLVFPSQVDGYYAYCPELDEDLYEIETVKL